MARNRRGMALVIVLIAMLCFSVIMFGIAQQQAHETRWTAISLDQQRAFVLADAGLARAMARHIARPYDQRWYGAAPGMKDDAIADNTHAGRFDESSQLSDESGAGGAPTAAQKLEPHGTYSVLVEDRPVGEFQQAPPIPSRKLMFTDVYSKGSVEGQRGPVSALLFARIVIAPEVDYFPPQPPTAGATPTTPPPPALRSTPELVKRVIRYKVYFDPEIADKDFQAPNADTLGVRQLVHDEVALFHQNFLKNRNTFKDFRDPAKLGPTWPGSNFTKPKWTKAEINGLFSGFAPAADVPGGTTNMPDAADGTLRNLWVEELLRRYRISDLVPANTGFRYLIPKELKVSPGDAGQIIARNLMTTFSECGSLVPVDPAFLEVEGSGSPVTTGDALLEKQKDQAKLNQKPEDYNLNVSHWVQKQVEASILRGHWNPHPDPSPPPEDKSTIARSFQDFVFEGRFRSATGTPPTKEEMIAEISRANALGAQPQMQPQQYVHFIRCAEKNYAYMLRYNPPTGGAAPPEPIQLGVDELVRFYSKYVESAAKFTNGDREQIFPIVPPLPTTPPTQSPSNPPGPGPSGGTPGGGGPPPRPGGYTMGGSTAGG